MNNKYFEQYYISNKEKLDNLYLRLVNAIPFLKDRDFRLNYRRIIHRNQIIKLIILCNIFIFCSIIYASYNIHVDAVVVTGIEILGIILVHHIITSKERWELFKLDLIDYMETKVK